VTNLADVTVGFGDDLMLPTMTQRVIPPEKPQSPPPQAVRISPMSDESRGLQYSQALSYSDQHLGSDIGGLPHISS
jgi:hypothetical protein